MLLIWAVQKVAKNSKEIPRINWGDPGIHALEQWPGVISGAPAIQFSGNSHGVWQSGQSRLDPGRLLPITFDQKGEGIAALFAAHWPSIAGANQDGNQIC
jgi:hypothetical protein